MPRPQTLFVIAAVVALVLGLVTSRLSLSTGMALTLPGASYVIPNSMLCYGAALFFCLFAFLYSIWMVPWSIPAATWHFALSIFAVVAFLAASIQMQRFRPDAASSPASITVLLAFSLSPIFFLAVQGLFLLDGMRRLLSLLLT
jgi:hypothetical protein